MLCRFLRIRIEQLFGRDMANFHVDYGDLKGIWKKLTPFFLQVPASESIKSQALTPSQLWLKREIFCLITFSRIGCCESQPLGAQAHTKVSFCFSSSKRAAHSLNSKKFSRWRFCWISCLANSFDSEYFSLCLWSIRGQLQ